MCQCLGPLVLFTVLIAASTFRYNNKHRRAAPYRLNRVSIHIWQALRVDQKMFVRGTCPVHHVGRGDSEPITPRNSSASGQLTANASLTRLVVSLIRTATLSSRGAFYCEAIKNLS